MIDGLGPTGVEGAFTKASELTMRVLKNNTSALLTILTSIAADPLYMWAMSPVKARARQLAREKDDEDEEDDEDVKEDDDTEALVDVLKGKHDKEKSAAKDSASRNDQATHIIAKIQQKLQGYEEATSGEQQGIGGQIQLLINQARDPENLAVMFPGWAPWV
jgi:ataxia telangiectasia mutated family protein